MFYSRRDDKMYESSTISWSWPRFHQVGCVIYFLSATLSSTIAFTCNPYAIVCQTALQINYRMTMVHDRLGAVFSSGGSLFRLRDLRNGNVSQVIPADDVVSADGWTVPRLVTVANRTMPGPPIIATKGQRLKVKVINQLRSETITIHWHGIIQKGTPYMDGVHLITQCPIQPGSSFTYEFDLPEAGTFFYHSHTANQQADGLFGALIIQERNEDATQDAVLQIQEWNHDFGMDLLTQVPILVNNVNILTGIYTPSPKAETRPIGFDGTEFTVYDAQSVLINGKGRYYDQVTGYDTEAPFHITVVKRGTMKRFRLIGVGIQFPIRVSIDYHDLTVISSDGQPIEPITVESVVVHPGERYDFIVYTNKAVGNYWIRARTLEANKLTNGNSIMRYEGAIARAPKTSQRNCSPFDECTVLNCPFKFFPESKFTRCIGIETLRYPLSGSMKSRPVDFIPSIPVIGVRQEFLNFRLKSTPGTHPTTNDIMFRESSVPFILHPDELARDCDRVSCTSNRICRCAQSFSVGFMEPLIMIFTVLGIDKEPHHPIHLHGHSFRILKVGYPEYDQITGRKLYDNRDLDCGYLDGKYGCEWRNNLWATGQIPGLELRNPPLKDTVVVPSGGYVIVHIITDNPGTWLIHCHVRSHVLGGMSIVLNEASDRIPPPPEGFPKCGNFPPDSRFRSEPQMNCFVPRMFEPCVDNVGNCDMFGRYLCTNPLLRFYRERNCRRFCNLCISRQ